MDTAVISNTRMLGGGERSAQKILSMLLEIGESGLGYSLNPQYKRSCGMEAWRDYKSCKSSRQIWVMNDAAYRLKDNSFKDFICVADKAQEIYLIFNFVEANWSKEDLLADLPIKKVFFLNESKRKTWLRKATDRVKRIPTKSLPPAVDISLFTSANGRRRLGASNVNIGSHGGKFSRYSVEMFSKLGRYSNLDLRFLFLPGNPSMYEVFGDDRKFSFFDRVKNIKDIVTFLQNLDIYVYDIDPKYHTQGPRAVVEAMAAGLPVVTSGCTECGMIDRIDHGITGFLCNGIDEMLDAILYLSNDKDTRMSMSKSAIEVAREMRPEKWVEEIVGI